MFADIFPLIFGSFNVTSFVTVILIVLTIHLYPRLKNIGYNLPPGPIGLPIVGYFPFISKKDPHLDLEKLRYKYGNIFGMYVGSKFMVILSDFQSVKKAYNKEEFLGRPDGYFRVSATSPNFADSNGKAWIDQRRFIVNTFKSQFGPNNAKVEEIIMDEVRMLVKKVSERADKERMFIRSAITPSLNNIIFRIVTGARFKDDDELMEILTKYEDAGAVAFTNISVLYCFPWLASLHVKFNVKLQEAIQASEDLGKCLEKVIEEHKNNLDEDNPKDYIDHYLIQLSKENNPDSFSHATLNANSIFLLFAGSDTVRNTLEWVFLILAKFPDIQEKLYHDVVDNFGNQHIPSWTERQKIPYTMAVLMEVTRWRTLTVLNCLRETSGDVKIDGFDIPKGTLLMSNIWACHMNPDDWKNPTEFCPERFLSEDKTRVLQKENLIPFSYGRRDCPGDKLAMIQVYLVTTAMIQQFKFAPPTGGLSLETYVKINAQSRNPFVKIVPR